MSRVAVLTPLPPQRGGVADYSRSLLEAMGRRAEVDVYAERPASPVPGVRLRRPTRRALLGLDRADAVIAHMGNSPAHAWILDLVRRRPAVVALHDLVLHHLIADVTLGRGDRAGYADAMAREAGRAGRLLGMGVGAGVVPGLWIRTAHLYPMTGEALSRARAVVVHSRFAAERVRGRRPDLPVHVVPLLTPEPPPGDAEALPGAPFPVVGCFGFVIHEKRLPTVARAVALARRRLPRARLLVVGEAPRGIDPHAIAAGAGLPPEALTVVGYADVARFDRLMRATHVAVSLRHPTMGESSAAVMRQLSLGVPTVVSPGGSYDELPDAAVVRVAPDDDEAARLAEEIARLAEDGAARAAMGEAGRRYARAELSPDAAADAYLRIALAPAGREPLMTEALGALARDLADVAPAPARAATGVSAELARALREVGL